MFSSIRRGILYLFILAALVGWSVSAQDETDPCGIMIGTAETLSSRPTRYETIFFSFDGENYSEVFTIGGRTLSFSPDRRFVAVEHPYQADPVVTLFDIAQNEPVENAVIPDVMLIRGEMWSHNSDKLLLTDNSDFLYLYDLTDNTLTRLLPEPDLILRVFQVAWSLDDEFIAFVAWEAPFPKTEYGFNQAIALYIVTADGSEYWPISAPDEQVGYYYEQFVWLPDSSIAFTSCHAERQDCCLSIVTTTGERSASFDGDYALLGQFSPEELIVASNKMQNHGGQQMMEVWLLNTVNGAFESLGTLPAIYSAPYPFFELSPDKNWLSFENLNRQISLVDRRDSSAYSIDIGPNYLLGGWHPDSRQLLVYGDNTFAIYDVNLNRTSLTIDLPDSKRIVSASWFCP